MKDWDLSEEGNEDENGEKEEVKTMKHERVREKENGKKKKQQQKEEENVDEEQDEQMKKSRLDTILKGGKAAKNLDDTEEVEKTRKVQPKGKNSEITEEISEEKPKKSERLKKKKKTKTVKSEEENEGKDDGKENEERKMKIPDEFTTTFIIPTTELSRIDRIKSNLQTLQLPDLSRKTCPDAGKWMLVGVLSFLSILIPLWLIWRWFRKRGSVARRRRGEAYNLLPVEEIDY